MRVLIIEPLCPPREEDIDPGLKSLQSAVGGYIQAVYPYEDNVALICHEEGKLIGLPPNRSLKDDDGKIYDVIAGTFLVCGLNEDNFDSLTPEQLNHYKKEFGRIEMFMTRSKPHEQGHAR